jgi:hypothetical protein
MGEHPGVTRRRAGRRSARRWPSLAVIAAGSLAVGALPAVDDPRPAGASTDPGAIALWAGASESDGLTWSASKSQAGALVHSNGDLVLSGSKNTLIGGVQYVDALTVSGSNNVIDPPPTATGVLDAPIAYEIDDYRPGGVAALAAGDLYFDHDAECAVDGTWEQHVHGTEIPSGCTTCRATS